VKQHHIQECTCLVILRTNVYIMTPNYILLLYVYYIVVYQLLQYHAQSYNFNNINPTGGAQEISTEVQKMKSSRFFAFTHTGDVS